MKKAIVIFFLSVLLLATVMAASDRPFFTPAKLEMVEFIRYNDGSVEVKRSDVFKKPDGVGKPPKDNDKEPECYTFLAGAKPRWQWQEGYVYNDAYLGDSTAWATSVWNTGADYAIFGSGVSGDYPWGVYDYVNMITYEDYPDGNVIGATRIWYQGKKIYEYDVLYDTDYFYPGSSYDLDTVVLHEMGHAAGLGDVYEDACVDVVMHGIYQGYPKLELAEPDLTGINRLY